MTRLMPEEYRFERISAELYPDFVELVRDSFSTNSSLDEVKRLFDTGEFGVDHVGFIAYHVATSKPAAFYGIFPCWVEIDGERMLAAQSGSTMTHPDHRKRDLFVRTAEKTYELAKKEGVAFVYGMPNQFSYRGLMKLGWTHLDNSVRYRLAVPTIPVGLLGRRSGILGRLHQLMFSHVTSFWKVPVYPMASSALERGVGGLHRSDARFDYKREDKSHMMLNVAGTDVWINQSGGQIGIGDIDLDSPGVNLHRIIRVLKLIAFLSGCNIVRTYVSPDCRLDREFRRAGFRGTEALANCYLILARDVQPERFKWVYADYDTF